MTVDQTSSPVHLSNSLLAEVARHTTIDIDNNVASIALQHNLAHRRMLELASTSNTSTPAGQLASVQSPGHRQTRTLCDISPPVVTWTSPNLGGPLSEGKIQVLATTIFTVEQGLVAAQASRAIYTAPYINALAAHFFAVDNPSEDERKKALEVGARSVKEVIIPLQRRLLRLRKDDARIKTQVMAASFLSIEKVIQLCGLDHQTLGAPIVEGLANTELTAEHKRKAEEAMGEFGVASDAELEEFGASVAAKKAEEVGYGGWLKEGSESYRRLAKVLSENERCKYMLDDALARFSKAEVNLRQLF
ncbi:hypothetical protein NDA18_001896 [Ustilago nuda]|nr:hypothetical protein NDA18_001896 [Ustilago nuda]